jgi:hypothetical protein
MKTVVYIAGLSLALLIGTNSQGEHFLIENAAQERFDILRIAFKPNEASVIYSNLAEKLNVLVEKRDFVGLEKIAASLRDSKTETANGTWHLMIFYCHLAAIGDKSTDIAWQNRLKFLSDWVVARPASITARVTLAE